MQGAGAAQQQIAEEGLRYRGGRPGYFLSCLTSETEKIIVEREIPAAELSPRVAFAIRIDSVARVSDFRFADSEHAENAASAEPVTEASRLAAFAAFARLGGEWTPARAGDRPVDSTLNLVLRIPVEKSRWMQDPHPLLFRGERFGNNIREWMNARVRYGERLWKVGGLVQVRFWVEADGGITIDRIDAPDERLGKEVERAIRSSRGKWTPRQVDGVPQRSKIDFRVNFNND